MSSNLSDQMSLGSLYSVVKTLIVSGAGQTRCPIELFWTAKNTNTQIHSHGKEGGDGERNSRRSRLVVQPERHPRDAHLIRIRIVIQRDENRFVYLSK